MNEIFPTHRMCVRLVWLHGDFHIHRAAISTFHLTVEVLNLKTLSFRIYSQYCRVGRSTNIKGDKIVKTELKIAELIKLNRLNK